jgi:hypothetical protein
MASKTVKTLAETRDWFKSTVIPKRTASAGFSGNRVWKSPQAIFRGNTEDPDGLCGDAAAYVIDEFYKEYDNYITSDGYTIGVILWKGKISNHIANVMLVKGKVGPEVYKWDSTSKTAITASPTVSSYSSPDLLRLYVYDLYYKKATTVEAWWQDLDSDMGGSIKIGRLFSIDD